MDIKNLKALVKEIVKMATKLKNKHTDEKNAPVNYACIFSQSRQEYEGLIKVVKKIGTVAQETPMGPVYNIIPIDTVSGKLGLLKIRLPDIWRPERGDADFTVSNYTVFKKRYLPKKGFKLIKREYFEMIELADADFNVLAYFSHPTLEVVLDLKSGRQKI